MSYQFGIIKLNYVLIIIKIISRRNGQSIPVLLGHCAVLVGNWPMTDCYFVHCHINTIFFTWFAK